MPVPIITLTTDFGYADHYVGTMKGVILGRCPQAQIVDVSHAVPKFSILAGAYTVGQSYRYFPRGAVHVVVVDPGVGTARRALLVEAMHQVFIGPDNGVFSYVFAHDRRARIREITNPALVLPAQSSTFHGRDVFAPALATIAAEKVWPEDAGPLVFDVVKLEELEAHEAAGGEWEGRVVSVDHFGNAITNIPLSRLVRLESGTFSLAVAGEIVNRFEVTFAEAAPDLVFAYAGSSGYLEIGMNQSDAASRIGIVPGDRVRLQTSL